MACPMSTASRTITICAPSPAIDAVLICSSGSHVPPALAALAADKHALVEKPLCYTRREAQAFVTAAQAARERSGTVTQLAYMKRYDPGYQYGQRRVRAMQAAGSLFFVDARHMHPSNDLYTAHHPVHRSPDVPAAVREAGQREHEAALTESLGAEATAAQRGAFGTLMGSSIHDIYSLRGLLGRPEAILSIEVWGHNIAALLRYPNGVRVNYTWADLGQLREFRQEFACYGADERVTITFPSPFLRSAPTIVTLQAMEEGSGRTGPYGNARHCLLRRGLQAGMAALPRVHHARPGATHRRRSRPARHRIHHRTGPRDPLTAKTDAPTAIKSHGPWFVANILTPPGAMGAVIKRLGCAAI